MARPARPGGTAGHPGGGPRGQDRHVDLVAVCDPVARSAQALAGAVGAWHVPDVPALLALGLDAVWVCVPPFAHGELELSIVRAGLPLLVEQPLAADLAVAERVAAAVSAAVLPTATGYHWRHLDTVERARAPLAGAAVRLVAARWWGATPPPAWWSRRDRSGGQVVEQATHVPDAGAAVLRLESGAVGTVSVSCVLPALAAAGLEVVADGVTTGCRCAAPRCSTSMARGSGQRC
ncbi:Gfo/Idh/MocA family oxidoreductase [Modestobacter sp. NPDC049651]|uniref:Gfo/Idh/MocA family protein n=1 Tax=unclassified Modestobacter TaxID=2643866 RepID=UPI0033C4D950